MKYERFTQWTESGASLILENPQNAEEARTQLMKKFKLACNKLAEFEDDLESGKIIRLPCKVDSEIYIISYLTDDEDKKHYYIRKSTFHPKWIDEWRNMFCLTREEAEAKLKELQNG